MTSDPITIDPLPVSRPWRQRLRITWSVFFGVLTVALCLLWVRSYWWWDSVSGGFTTNWYYTLDSVQGLCNGGIAPVSPAKKTPFEATVIVLEATDKTLWDTGAILGFSLWENDDEDGGFRPVGGTVPHWFLIALATVVAAFPWLPLRFSLRTMLVATTVIAVVLGAINVVDEQVTSMPSDRTTTTDPPVTPRKRRRLRVAWTMVFGSLTVALCVLWVRSYCIVDAFGISKLCAVSTCRGELLITSVADPDGNFTVSRGYGREDLPALDEPWDFRRSAKRTWNVIFAHGEEFPGLSYIVIEFPAFIVATASLAVFAAIPWLSHRFSLRTMLIATTVIAVALGAVVWSIR